MGVFLTKGIEGKERATTQYFSHAKKFTSVLTTFISNFLNIFY